MENRPEHGNSGYSLVEVLVAIALASLVIGFATGIYVIGQRYFVRWQDGLELQNEVHTLASALSNRIFEMDELQDLSPNGIWFTLRDSARCYYSLEDAFYGDSVRVNDAGTKVTSFVVSPVYGEWGQSGRSSEEVLEHVAFIHFRLEMSNGRDTLGVSRAIALRKPAPWNRERDVPDY